MDTSTPPSQRLPAQPAVAAALPDGSDIHVLQHVVKGQYVKVMMGGRLYAASASPSTASSSSLNTRFEFGVVTALSSSSSATSEEDQGGARERGRTGGREDDRSSSNNNRKSPIAAANTTTTTAATAVTATVQMIGGYTQEVPLSHLRRAFLAVLDLNGVLGCRVAFGPDRAVLPPTAPSGSPWISASEAATIHSSSSATANDTTTSSDNTDSKIMRFGVRTTASVAFVARPHLHHFLRFIFAHFVVGIWTSGERANAERIIEYCLGPMANNGIDFRRKLLFTMFREDATPCPTPLKPYATVKDLHKIFSTHTVRLADGGAGGGGDNSSLVRLFHVNNTVIVDDSADKCTHPDNALCPRPFTPDDILRHRIRVVVAPAAPRGKAAASATAVDINDLERVEEAIYAPSSSSSSSSACTTHNHTSEEEDVTGLLGLVAVLERVITSDSLSPVAHAAEIWEETAQQRAQQKARAAEMAAAAAQQAKMVAAAAAAATALSSASRNGFHVEEDEEQQDSFDFNATTPPATVMVVVPNSSGKKEVTNQNNSNSVMRFFAAGGGAHSDKANKAPTPTAAATATTRGNAFYASGDDDSSEDSSEECCPSIDDEGDERDDDEHHPPEARDNGVEEVLRHRDNYDRNTVERAPLYPFSSSTTAELSPPPPPQQQQPPQPAVMIAHHQEDDDDDDDDEQTYISDRRKPVVTPKRKLEKNERQKKKHAAKEELTQGAGLDEGGIEEPRKSRKDRAKERAKKQLPSKESSSPPPYQPMMRAHDTHDKENASNTSSRRCGGGIGGTKGNTSVGSRSDKGDGNRAGDKRLKTNTNASHKNNNNNNNNHKKSKKVPASASQPLVAPSSGTGRAAPTFKAVLKRQDKGPAQGPPPALL